MLKVIVVILFIVVLILIILILIKRKKSPNKQDIPYIPPPQVGGKLKASHNRGEPRKGLSQFLIPYYEEKDGRIITTQKSFAYLPEKPDERQEELRKLYKEQNK